MYPPPIFGKYVVHTEETCQGKVSYYGQPPIMGTHDKNIYVIMLVLPSFEFQ